MPIRPENKALYPDNWKEIRKDILKRANNHCEFCGVQNYHYRSKEDHSVIRDMTAFEQSDCWIDKLTLKAAWSRIVLTIAHLDHDPTNNNYNNLKALCQKCHLNYDKELHLLNRRKNLPTKDMFL